MVHESPQFEFVNRTEELSSLQQWANSVNDPPFLVFLRAPSGIGKSSLTNKLVGTLDRTTSLGVIIDPYGPRGSTMPNAVSASESTHQKSCLRAILPLL